MSLRIQTPFDKAQAVALRAGDSVLLSGTIYTARDAAHKRLYALLQEGKPLPFNLRAAIIYYVGPAPAVREQVIGSAGPTTSYRMDAYTPALLDAGLSGMIGKGMRSQAVTDAIVKQSAVYFGAIGGAGALLAQCVRSVEIIAYEDLASEAVRRLEVVDMPLVVLTDSLGNDFYRLGREAYIKAQ